MAQEVPYRFNADAVARYGGIMRQLSASWPNPISVDPAPLAIETYRSRFRDAVRGVVEYQQCSQELFDLVMAWKDNFSIIESGGRLLIGPKEVLKTRREKPLQAGLLVSGVATLANDGEAVVGPDKAIIQAIALLFQHGILETARLSGVTEDFINDCLPEDYDGGVVENADGTFSLY